MKSTKDYPVLPHNANLGTIQPFTPNHDKMFSEATDHTAATLVDTWFEYGKVRLKPLLLLQDLRHNLPVPLLHLSLGPYVLRHLRWQRLV